MSLRKAVEEVVIEMEREVQGDDSRVPVYALIPYVKLLKMALKASEGEEERKTHVSDADFHRQMVESAKQEFRRKGGSEFNEVEMMICQGGKFNGTAVSVPSYTEDGDEVQVGNERYVKQGGKLILKNSLDTP